ncbi:hypothetical protein JD844_019779 [Phrynosoma platyrhinos]|uniref:Uncharacterized protein n=1 Tax=Phrynosoma platyrhinos TaxID=52577 RepID=A0ABQ7TQ25_PHRPL|nr:hypothetical protein JD844_019779 [Phrynosoma platyrhinos]
MTCASPGKLLDRHPLVDALPSCKTEACVVLMKELIVSEEIEEDKIESFLWSLSFIPEPTAGMIDALTVSRTLYCLAHNPT